MSIMPDAYRHLERLQGLNDRLAAADPTLIVALGDSNTCNTKFTAGGKQWPELLHSRLKDHHGHQRVLLLNAGVSGDCVERALERFDSDVTRVSPDGCVLCLGSNDAKHLSAERFRAGYERILDRLAELDCAVLVRTATPVLEYMDGEPDRLWTGDDALRATMDIVRAIADERGLAFVDTYQLFWDAVEAGSAVPGELYRDAVHTNAAGHSLVYEQLLPAFGITSEREVKATAADGTYRAG